MKATETYDLVKTLVEAIDLSFEGDSVVDLTGGHYKIFTENTKWITKGYTLTTNAVDYVVEDLSFNEWVKVSGVSIPTDLSFDIYAPKFHHGTVLEEQQVLNLITNSLNKLPLIWLKERVRERFEPDETLRLDRESDCDIYFLIDCNMEDWLRLDFDNYTIKPMRSLVAAFMDVLYDAPNVSRDYQYEVTDDAKFGRYQDDKGNTKKIFGDALSGSFLKITIPFLKPNC